MRWRKESMMPGPTKTLSGYVKTSNMYLIVMVALAAGFLGGVIFSSYRNSSVAIVPGNPGLPGTTPMTQEQSKALTELLQATSTTPGDVNAWTQLGHLYYDTEQYGKAVQAYEKSLELDPSRPDVWTDLGVMYRRTGNPSQAVQCFDHALSIAGSHETALFNKGVVLMHDIKDPQAALKAWEKLVQINPNAQTPDGRTVKSMIDQVRKANPS
jgi:cytochrome c-type biogenesis protein CcmH/NrfG